MTISINFAPIESTFDLRSLKPRTRNQVRALLFAPPKSSISLLNKIRAGKSAKEIFQIERVLRDFKRGSNVKLPDLFPSEIQTKENYYRLCALTPEKQIAQLHYLLEDHETTIERFISHSTKLGMLITCKNLFEADQVIQKIVREFGYSNYILRKALLVHIMNEGKTILSGIDDLFDKAGIGANNFLAASTLRCYQKEQNILSLKRSVMNLTNRGLSNRFTRDIIRLSFHPHAASIAELGEMIQSNLQSSLIDAMIILKVNRDLFGLKVSEKLISLFDHWDQCNVEIDAIASLYTSMQDGESLFYKHSSAWLEHREIISYRFLQDHFYDDPDSNYFIIDENLIKTVGNWIKDLKPEEIATNDTLTAHSHP